MNVDRLVERVRHFSRKLVSWYASETERKSEVDLERATRTRAILREKVVFHCSEHGISADRVLTGRYGCHKKNERTSTWAADAKRQVSGLMTAFQERDDVNGQTVFEGTTPASVLG